MKKILYSRGELDVLDYYSKTAVYLKRFLKGKMLASKISLPDFFFIKRGSKEKPLFIEDFRFVDEKMLELRKGNHLKDVKSELNEKQILIWEYFVPRKLVQFFYATNGENPGKPVSRIFIDIDRKKQSSENARKVTLALFNLIKKDKEFNKMFSVKKTIVLWTGSSFHIYIDLTKKIKPEIYNSHLSYGKGKEKSFIAKWADEIKKKTGIEVEAGHEKSSKKIILDSSGTPSGKLARAPFSLHVKNEKEIDGVCVPVSETELKEKELIKRLEKLTPDDVLKNLKKYGRLLF
jgi:hypothetical protein